jgi:hypothetical protein
VRAEHASVRVRLVDNYVSQPPEELGPARVRRQYPAMNHVRIGEDPARVRAHPVALLHRGVPVETRRAHIRQVEFSHCAQLVGAKSFGRRQVQRRAPAVGSEGGQHGQLVGQRLSRGGTGGQHHVAAVPHVFGGFDLMRPWLSQTARLERRHDLRRRPRRPLRVPGFSLRQVFRVGQRVLISRNTGEYTGKQLPPALDSHVTHVCELSTPVRHSGWAWS